MKCLIIAAGKGERLRERFETKPLFPVAGKPLIEHVVLGAREGGVQEFVVVTGYHGPQVRAFLDGLSARTGLAMTHVVNEEWERPNGLSVLKARDVLTERFLLVMADHLFDPVIVADLLAEPHSTDEVVLAVDRDLSNPYVDLSDVTRVRSEHGMIREIGKGIPIYDAFDTGIFFASPALFDALERSALDRGDASLSGGMNVLARESKARTFDVSGHFWIDVDDAAAAVLAEDLVLAAGR